MTGGAPARALVLHPEDTVATLLGPAAAGETVALSGAAGGSVRAVEPTAAYFKIALADLAEGETVLKYGQPIGRATAAVRAGGLVHVHNLRSSRAQPATASRQADR